MHGVHSKSESERSCTRLSLKSGCPSVLRVNRGTGTFGLSTIWGGTAGQQAVLLSWYTMRGAVYTSLPQEKMSPLIPKAGELA